jgi:hypothetical protein
MTTLTIVSEKGSSQMPKAQTTSPHLSPPALKEILPEDSLGPENGSNPNGNNKTSRNCPRYLAGCCNKGSSCHYHHPPVSVCRTTHPSVMAATLNMKNFCTLAVLGECPSPDRCGLPHVPAAWTAKICRSYLKKWCRAGRSCTNFHPPRKEVSLVNDGTGLSIDSFAG